MQNKPKLRFKEFNQEIDIKKLKDISNPIKRVNDGEEHPIMMLSAKHGFIHQSEKYGKDMTGESLKKYTLLNQGEIAYNRGNSKTSPYGCIFELKEKTALVPYVYHCFKLKEKYDSCYYGHYLNSGKLDKQLKQIISSSARMDGLLNVSAFNFFNINVLSPSLPEQEKIANFLLKVDELINEHESEVADLEAQKKGLMQKLFTQQIRFKDSNGNNYPNWQEYKLGKVCKTFSGGTPSVTKSQYYSGKIPFIKSGEIHSSTTEMYITEEGLNNSSAKLVGKGDLLFALYGATSGEVDISQINGAINQAILCIRSDKLNLFYLKYLLQFNKDKILAKYLQGGQGNLSADIFKSFKFDFPCRDEQEVIADKLGKMDEFITEKKALLEDWKQFKKGLLQQMFV